MYRIWTQTDYRNKHYNLKFPKTCTGMGHKHTNKTSTTIKTKVATTCTGDGHKHTTKTSTTI